MRPGAAAALVRAWASIRSRPASAALVGVGLGLVGLMVGAAVSTGAALSGGLDRAQRAAASPDLTVRFDRVERGEVERRLAGLANVRSASYRLTVRGVSVWYRRRGGAVRVELNAIAPASATDGLAIVEGRALSGSPGEIVIERGFAREAGISPGTRMWIPRADRPVTVVGVSIEPDNVAYPLASEPRFYMAYDDWLSGPTGTPGRQPVSAVNLRLVDPARLPETLVQARVAGFGLGGARFSTRAGTRALINQAGGLVTALIGGFALIGLAAAATMLASSAHARVARELPTFGAMRAIGFGPAALAGSYAAEAAIVAAATAGPGIVIGALVVTRPVGDFLAALNGLAPGFPLGLWHLGAFVAVLVLAALAAGWPALASARRPVAETLSGGLLRPPRRAKAVGRPFALGARLAVARPGRLGMSALAIAGALATVLILLSLGRFLLTAQREPAALGERYSLIVSGGADVRARLERRRDVAAAVPRVEAVGADAFDLGEPIRFVAFGDGREEVFPGRPLLQGRRAGPGEAEIGSGLADSLGLAPGGRLIAQVEGGGEIRLSVSGVVQELTFDGRVAYTDAGSLLTAAPGLWREIAVRPAAGVGIEDLMARLGADGLDARTVAGLVAGDASFLGTVVVLIAVVGVLNVLVCAALVMAALIALARERAETIGVLRAHGGTARHVWLLLAGAGALLCVIGLAGAWALQRLVIAPALVRMVERYGVVRFDVAAVDLLAVGAAALTGAAAAAALVARRYSRQTIASLLASS